ncbi:MAG: YfiR family protein, partial [Deltaproteobacteria bacterium]|nr:YfiR family protein [Deltaproteobacteria bacterium]
ILVLFPTFLIAQEGTEPEDYQVKGNFLYHFGKFVDWPDSALKGSFQICIIGSDPFGKTLDESMQGKTIKDKNIQISRMSNAAGAGACQIAFVDSSANAAELIAKSKTLPILTVGESPDFNQKGGMIQFVVQNNKVRFVINAAAAEKSGLKISSQLLKLSM